MTIKELIKSFEGKSKKQIIKSIINEKRKVEKLAKIGAALNIITVEILLDISKWFVLIAILGAVVSLVGSFFAFSVTDGCRELDFPDDFVCLVFGTLLIVFALAVCGLTSFVIASTFYR